MLNVLKVLPLTILLALATDAGASTTPPGGPDAGAKPAGSTKAPASAASTRGSAKPTGTPKTAPTATKAGKTAKPATTTAPAPAKVGDSAKAGNTGTGNAAKGSATGSAKSAAKAKGTAPVARRASATAKPAKRTLATTRTAAPRLASAPAMQRPAYRPPAESHGDRAVDVESGAALVVDAAGQVIYSKNPDEVLPIASITKLMTALVVMDSRLPLDEPITITADDKDYLRNTHSRLQVGSQLTRRELLHIALMSSENRAAAALARTHPAGRAAFVQLMNAKARVLGMQSTRFADSTGLDGGNVSTARDLVKLAQAASGYPLIREFTTTTESEIEPGTRRTPMLYRNSNRLVHGGHWDIQLSKTGYLNEAGRCLLMQAEVAGRPLVFVFLSGPGRLTPMGDANRIRVWLENGSRTG